MSSRENLGLRAASLLLLMTTVVMAVSAYAFHRSADEKSRQLAAAVESERQVMHAFEVQNAYNQVLRHQLGHNPLTEMELMAITQAYALDGPMLEVDAAFQKDVAQYGANVLPNQRNYRGMLRHANEVMRSRNDHVTRSAQRELELIEEREELREELERQITKLKQAHQAAVDDLQGQRSHFTEDRNRLQTMNDELARQVSVRQQALAELMVQHEKEVSELHTQSRLLQLRLDAAADKIARLKGLDVPNEPDGEITWVGGRTKSAQINLGAADGLKRQITFLVYDKSSVWGEDAETKGKIEVTAVKDAHRAEVRIIEEQLNDPIMPGDKVYSPAWRKGERVRFAIVGLLDMDGDGDSDVEKVKGLIAASGGSIDAELLADGTIAGKMTLETDFLVRGDPPRNQENQEIPQSYTSMIDDAGRLGIPLLPLDRFLALLGYDS